jgi:hypothetical protein
VDTGKKHTILALVAAGGLLVTAAAYYFLWSGPTGPPQRPVYAAEGFVRFRGKPVEGGRVMLHPEEQGKDRFLPNAVTGPGGAFKLTTYQRDDGAPAGRYKVAIAWTTAKGARSADADAGKGPAVKGPKVPEAAAGQNKYGDPQTSGLTAVIRADAPNMLEFDLK